MTIEAAITTVTTKITKTAATIAAMPYSSFAVGGLLVGAVIASRGFINFLGKYVYPVSETSVDDREYLGTWAHQLFDDFSKVDLERYSSLKTTQKIVCTVKMIFIGIGVGMLFNSMINLSAYFIGVRVLTLNQFLLSSILGGIYGFLEDRSTRGSAEAWCMGRRAAALAMA